MSVFIRKNFLRIIVLAVLGVLFIAAAQGMESKDFVITLLRGLSVGSLTFLVASGFSLIFGLLDVLNLAHGTLFMIGAYIGWTVYVRPDTFVDLLAPLALIFSGFMLGDVWTALSTRSLFQSRLTIEAVSPLGGAHRLGVDPVWRAAKLSYRHLGSRRLLTKSGWDLVSCQPGTKHPATSCHIRKRFSVFDICGFDRWRIVTGV